MPKCIPEHELQAIRAAVPVDPGGASTQQIAGSLGGTVPLRTLQYRLRHLVETGLLEQDGRGRWVKYRQPDPGLRLTGEPPPADRPFGSESGGGSQAAAQQQASHPCADLLSPKSAALRLVLQKRRGSRRLAESRRRLLEEYRPNVTAYLGRRDRARLATAGVCSLGTEPPGTAARRLGETLAIELTWNTSRLAGSSYSELEVRRLVKFGRAAEGRDPIDTQSVVNHREALRFLLDLPGQIAIDHVTLCNLHAILAHNLLPDEAEAGRLRQAGGLPGAPDAGSRPHAGTSVQSTFQCMIETARAIADPLEQALFILVQLPYLAPFEAMNDRVARLAVNLPLIRHNLLPLSFADVPVDLFTYANRAVAERGRIDLLKDIFLWSCERSGRLPGAGHPAPGAPDPLRLEFDQQLRCLVADVVRQQLPPHAVRTYVETWSRSRIRSDARDRFVNIVHGELRGLHDGNFARFPLTLHEFRAWQAAWSGTAARA